MNAHRFLIPIVILSFLLGACSGVSEKLPTVTPVPAATRTPLPTNTPYPTYTVLPSETLTSTPVPSTPTLVLLFPDMTQIFADIQYHGDTFLAANYFFFLGQEGGIVSIVETGIRGANRVPTRIYYQEFSIRDNQNNALAGCQVESPTNCSIRNYKLPYSGIFYIRFDRTANGKWATARQCISPKPDLPQCFRGGPYYFTLTVK